MCKLSAKEGEEDFSVQIYRVKGPEKKMKRISDTLANGKRVKEKGVRVKDRQQEKSLKDVD